MADLPATLAFGLTATERPGSERLGAELEALGYGEVWVNDTRRGDGIATLASLVATTHRMRIAVGVVALSEHRPREIVVRLESAGLPLERLTLGVGSGSSRSLALVRDGVAELRAFLPEVPLAVAAVGPRMTRLAGEISDGVVTAWATPDRLAQLAGIAGEGARASGRPAPRMVAYVRTAVGPGAQQRLRSEMDRYARYGSAYAKAFADQPRGLIGVAVESGDPHEIATALEPYRPVVDTLVVRGVPSSDEVDGWIEVARACAPSSPSPGSG